MTALPHFHPLPAVAVAVGRASSLTVLRHLRPGIRPFFSSPPFRPSSRLLPPHPDVIVVVSTHSGAPSNPAYTRQELQRQLPYESKSLRQFRRQSEEPSPIRVVIIQRLPPVTAGGPVIAPTRQEYPQWPGHDAPKRFRLRSILSTVWICPYCPIAPLPHCPYFIRQQINRELKSDS